MVNSRGGRLSTEQAIGFMARMILDTMIGISSIKITVIVLLEQLDSYYACIILMTDLGLGREHFRTIAIVTAFSHRCPVSSNQPNHVTIVSYHTNTMFTISSCSNSNVEIEKIKGVQIFAENIVNFILKGVNANRSTSVSF